MIIRILNEIWIDLNAGDMGEGLMLNTFAHEMYHHIEKWNPEKANALAEFLIQELGGESVEAAVRKQIRKAEKAGFGVEHFVSKGMSQSQAENTVYQRAMSDFVADSLETMFTRGDAAQILAKLRRQDKGLFNRIRKFVDQWLGKLRQYYENRTVTQEGATVAELKSFEKIQQMFLEAMAEAGENYEANQETVKEGQRDSEIQKELPKTEAEIAKTEVAQANEDLEAQYSWKNDSKGNRYWYIDTQKDIFNGLQTISEYENAAFRYILGQRDNNVVIGAIDGKKMSFIRVSAEEFTNSEESKDLKANNPIMFAQKMRLIPSLEDMASNANVNWWSPDHKHHRLFKQGGFENFRGRVGIDNVIFNYVIRAGKARFGDVFYDINLEVDQILPHANGTSEIKRPASKITIPQTPPTVNTGMNSLREESEVSTSPRALLANALESVAQTPHERQRLQEYRAKLEQMNAQEQRLRELNAQIKEMAFSSEMLALQYFFTIHYYFITFQKSPEGFSEE